MENLESKEVVLDNLNGLSEGNCSYCRSGYEATWVVSKGLTIREVAGHIGTNYFETKFVPEESPNFSEVRERYLDSRLSPEERRELEEFLNSSDRSLIAFYKGDWRYVDEEVDED